MQDNSKQITVGAILSYIILIVSNVISLVYTPFLLHRLGQSEYGLYSLMSTFVAYLNVLDLGLNNAMIVYLSKSAAKKKDGELEKTIGSFLKIYFVLGFLALTAGVILFFLIDPLYSATLTSYELSRAKIMYIVLLVPTVLSFPCGVFNSLITVNEQFIFQKIVNLIKILIVPFVMIPLLLMGYKSLALIILTSIVSIVYYLVNYCYCKFKLKLKIIFDKIDKKIFKEIFIYSFFIFLGIIIDKVNNGIDQMILGATVGTAAVSIYSIGLQFNTIYISFSTSLSSVLLPKISKMVEKKASDDEISDLFIKTGRIQFLVLYLIMSGFVLFGNQFIRLWAGEEYAISYYIALFLMLPYTVPLIQNVGISILQAKNKHRFRVLCYFIIAVANVLISIPLAKMFQGLGCAIGTALAIILGNIIIINIYYKKSAGINITKFWNNIFRIFCAGIIPCLVGVLLNRFVTIGFGYINIGIKIIAFTVVYLLFMIKFGMNDYEKTFIEPFIRKIKRGNAHAKNQS